MCCVLSGGGRCARARAQSGVAWCRSPPYAPQTASLEGESHAFEAQGASRSLGGPVPVVMPHLGEDIVGSVLQKADAASFYAEP